MEFKKVVPNRQITKELMKRTYPKRRQEVLDGNVSIGKILEMYPALAHADEVNYSGIILILYNNDIHVYPCRCYLNLTE